MTTFSNYIINSELRYPPILLSGTYYIPADYDYSAITLTSSVPNPFDFRVFAEYTIGVDGVDGVPSISQEDGVSLSAWVTKNYELKIISSFRPATVYWRVYGY